MTRRSTSFARDRELIIVDADIVGPAGTKGARVVLDTGASATTLIPQVIDAIGYTRQDSYQDSSVHTAVGEEYGYWLRVAELTVLGVTTANFAVAVFPLPHGVEGLLGMNFLRYFNFEVRPAEQQIIVELIDPSRLIA